MYIRKTKTVEELLAAKSQGGRVGGSSITKNSKNKGFGSMSPERLAEVSRKGGKKSSRAKV